MSRVEETYIKMYILETYSYMIAIWLPKLFEGCHLVLCFRNILQEMWQYSDSTHISETNYEYPYFKKSTFKFFLVIIYLY